MNTNYSAKGDRTLRATFQTKLKTTKGFIRKFGNTTLVAILMISFGTMMTVTSGLFGTTKNVAHAVTDDYPDKDTVKCGGAYEYCDQNGNKISSRNFYYRNCTDWAAWRIKQITGYQPQGSLGSGGYWDDNKPASAEKDSRPEVGDAAIFNNIAAPHGHVAVVEKVNSDGTVFISEYNYSTAGGFGTRNNVRADIYVDFTPDVNEGNNPTSSSGSNERSDFNGSGRSDILLYTPTGTDSILYGRELKGDFGKYGYSLENDYLVAVGDYNDDGEDDIFAYGEGTDPDYIFYGKTTAATFSDRYLVSVNNHYDQVVPGDFNGDGIDDIMLYARGTGADKILSGTKTAGSLNSNTMNVQLEADYMITSGKYNDDGRSDLFLYNRAGADYVMYGREGRGDFGRYPISNQIDGIYEHPVSGDFNDNGFDDVLLYGLGTAVDKVFTGRATAGEFGVYGTTISNVYRPIGSGDYNGDGNEDVMMHGPGDTEDRVLYGTDTVGDFHSVQIIVTGDYRRIST